jgi:hypothetical protein
MEQPTLCNQLQGTILQYVSTFVTANQPAHWGVLDILSSSKRVEYTFLCQGRVSTLTGFPFEQGVRRAGTTTAQYVLLLLVYPGCQTDL